MLRLSPEGFYRLFQNDHFRGGFGGAEANVAVSLAMFGMDSCFVTKVPNHVVGQAAINSLRSQGVDTSKIVRGGERLGIYFQEKGVSQRSGMCIYDRAHSAIAEAAATDFDWNEIMDHADWFHFTGITPALGANVEAMCEDACRAAKRNGAIISCDLNYREKLWTREAAYKAMSRLCRYVDVCVANEEDAKNVFEISAEGTDALAGIINRDAYSKVAQSLMNMLGISCIAFTLRESDSASINRWSGMLFDGEKAYFSRTYSLHIVDRIGGGDSFSAGLIYALLQKKNPQQAVEFAAAASALKQSIEGDYNRVSVDEVNRLVHGDMSGRVQR